jgi:hypothetical protein
VTVNTAWVNRVARRPGVIGMKSGSQGSYVGDFASQWLGTAIGSNPYWPAGATPPSGSGGVCDDTTTGAFVIPAESTARRLVGMSGHVMISSGVPGWMMLVDRLVATSGLVTTVTTAQTVNSVALSRYTSGDGVWMCLECYTGITYPASSTTVSYTNEQGVSGRTSVMGAAFPDYGPGSIFPLRLQAGDRGVRSVQTVTLSASNASTNNFGVTLFKPLSLCNWTADNNENPSKDQFWDWRLTGLVPVPAGACLGFIGKPFASVSQSGFSATILTADE